MKARFNFSKGSLHIEVDVSIKEHGITAIFGPSGCGKTSLLRAIAGLDKYPEAQVSFAQNMWQAEGQFVRTEKRSIGYVFQEASLFSHLNVQQNLDYAIKRAPKNRQPLMSFESLVELLGITSLLDKKASLLSGGERQRVALARALLSKPQLLLMDEPLSALDQKAKQQILPLIEQCQKEVGIPIIYVSHALDEVSRLADTVLLMESGKISHQGPVQDVLTGLDSPLALSPQAESLVDAQVATLDEQYHLAYLDSAIGRFAIAAQGLVRGQKVRLRLAARDISLTLDTQKDTSILNIFAAKVDHIILMDGAFVTVRLLVGATPILARLTKKSASLLSLKKGRDVYAQVKSVAVLDGVNQ